jgi:hypothetical protein
LDEATKEDAHNGLTISVAKDGDRILLGSSGQTTHLSWTGDGWTA